MAERWKKCIHNNHDLHKENSIYCKLEGGYVSPKWCELCLKFKEASGK